MKILLDECVTKKLRSYLSPHEVFTVSQMKWNGLRNGNLMKKAETENFDLLITIDKNLRFQQNIGKSNLTVIVFDSVSSKIEQLKKFIPKFKNELGNFKKGQLYILSAD